MLSTDNWCIKVAERVYGPYSTDQLETFAEQGRLGPQSLVAPAGGKMWRAAKQYPNIAEILEGGRTETITAEQVARSIHKKPGEREDPEIANFLVIFDVVSGAASRLEHVIRNLGPAFRVTDNVWAVSSDQTLMGLKNLLTPHLQVREPVFIVDSTRGRSIWQNFPPEQHSKMIKAWLPR
ncbi:DUF4339 domain-containing protein [Aquisalinus flavus]|uniref:GYF domain-containing protein n=1 Tax=Aquisalinus flavus TaxID=1526572 RepID=A0A8J2V221_9PROT|nr:DUF4339 domain-containing protein [Aquisalinus flavus]MBD0426548.1 DUF4339 domain-containing protein [Aquisalinus flavus]UNE47903.1 DUF4339 domain-containing protein [Aquisalinus flavus]GGD07079.1 hypothetical protein GCM10011342_14860 [Aquisalinus flavus]